MKKLLAILLAATMIIAMISGCSSGDGDSSSNEGKKTMVTVGLTNTYDTMTPFFGHNPYRYMTLTGVYQYLAVTETPGSEELTGALAKEWKQIDDLTWEFTLYDYIKDSAGNPFTAEDAVWVFDTAKENGLSISNRWDHAEYIDEYTFRLVLATTAPGTLLNILTTQWMCTKEAYEASPDGMATTPVGTGPYVLKDYTTSTSITLEKNENFWQTDESLVGPTYKANVDVIKFLFINEVTQMDIALENGTIQMAMWADLSLYDEFKDSDEYDIHMEYATGSKCIGYSMIESSPFYNNADLRKAITYAIDTKSIVDAISFGTGTVSKAWGDECQIGYDTAWEDNPTYYYDVDLAKQYLASAGYKPGELKLIYNCHNTDSAKTEAEIIQANLAAIGVELELNILDSATWGEYQDASMGMYDISPLSSQYNFYWEQMLDTYLRLRGSGRTWSGIYDEELNELYQKVIAVGGGTQENRQALYEYLDEQCYIYQMYKQPNMLIHSKDISDIAVNSKIIPSVGGCTFSEDWNHFAD